MRYIIEYMPINIKYVRFKDVCSAEYPSPILARMYRGVFLTSDTGMPPGGISMMEIGQFPWHACCPCLCLPCTDVLYLWTNAQAHTYTVICYWLLGEGFTEGLVSGQRQGLRTPVRHHSYCDLKWEPHPLMLIGMFPFISPRVSRKKQRLGFAPWMLPPAGMAASLTWACRRILGTHCRHSSSMCALRRPFSMTLCGGNRLIYD